MFSCAHQSSQTEDLSSLDLSTSFAVSYNGKKIYFGRSRDNSKCDSFVGSINGNPKYLFSVSAFKDLNDSYEQLKSPEHRISRFISKLDQIQNKHQKCEKKSSYILLFSPLMVFSTRNLIETSFDKLRLGMTLSEVKSIIKKPLEVREEAGHKYHYVTSRNQRLVMYFDKNILYAWLRGARPTE